MGDGYQYKTDLQRLIIMRSIRLDKVVLGMVRFVVKFLGQEFVEPPPLNYQDCFNDSTVLSPLIFILSAGADPMADLLLFAANMKMDKKLDMISLGQGQGPKAEAMMKGGQERGRWVLLQNCHLAVSWMPRMESIVEKLDASGVHKDYRLWLTSQPSPKFPVYVLQNGVKMTLEPPKGIKANCGGAYYKFTDGFMDKFSGHARDNDWRKLLYGLVHFHAVLLERKKYGPLGLNITYEFTEGDRGVNIIQLELLLRDYEEIPFKIMQILATEVNYGGRVTDTWDIRLINNMVIDCCKQEVCEVGYKFSEAGKHYTLHDGATLDDYNEYMKNLPGETEPDICGLHSNAEITCAQNEALDNFRVIQMQQPAVTSGGGKSRDEIITEACIDMQERVIKPIEVEPVQDKYPVLYEESMNTVLVQEVIRYNRMLSLMHVHLKDIQLGIKGIVVMSGDLEDAASSLYNNAVPDAWMNKGYPSLNPLAAWVNDLVARMEFVGGWIDKGIPPIFWLPGFFFPQAFLTGTLQNYARKYKMAIDTVSFDFEYIDDRDWKSFDKRPEDGAVNYGLFLEGAGWDYTKHMLCEATPKVLFAEFPIIWLKPVQNRDYAPAPDAEPRDGIYICPCYKVLSRKGVLSTTGHSTNYVCPLELPSNMPQMHWTKRSVALFTQLRY